MEMARFYFLKCPGQLYYPLLPTKSSLGLLMEKELRCRSMFQFSFLITFFWIYRDENVYGYMKIFCQCLRKQVIRIKMILKQFLNMAMPYILKNILRLISFPELSYSGDVSNQTVAFESLDSYFGFLNRGNDPSNSIRQLGL